MDIEAFFTKIFDKRFITALLVLLMIFLISGGVYVVVEHPPAAVPISERESSFIWIGLTVQTTTEFFAAFFLISIGLVGVYILIEERKADKISSMRLIVALTFIIISFILLEYLIKLKLGG